MLGLLGRRPAAAAPATAAAAAAVGAGRRSRSRCSPAASPTSCCARTAGASCAPAIGRGIDALPGARVPYRGARRVARLVIPLGGTVLVVLARAARLLAARPRAARLPRRRAGRARDALRGPRRGARSSSGEFLRGALLALLVVAFLRLERLRRRDAPAAAALALAAPPSLALVARARARRRRPVVGLRDVGARRPPAAQSTDVRLGPRLRAARLAARRPRAAAHQGRASAPTGRPTNLDVFDGRRWVREPRSWRRARAAASSCPATSRSSGAGRRTSGSRVRNLRSDTFVDRRGRDRRSAARAARGRCASAGIYAAARTLRRGDAYTARVYVAAARPSAELRDGRHRLRGLAAALPRARSVDPARARPWRQRDSGSVVPGARRARHRRPSRGPMQRLTRLRQPEHPGDDAARAIGARPRLDARAAAARGRRHAVRVRARASSATSRDGLRLLRDAAARGRHARRASCSTRKRRLLPAVLGRDGAAAADGRRSRPASRPASRPGSLRPQAREYVVRDLDAHSWVEAWFPGIGWVTLRPDAGAAPPRSQADGGRRTPTGLGDVRDIGGRRGADPTRAATLGHERADALVGIARRPPRPCSPPWRSSSRSARRRAAPPAAARGRCRARARAAPRRAARPRPARRCPRSRPASARPRPRRLRARAARAALRRAHAARRPRSAAACAPRSRAAAACAAPARVVGAAAAAPRPPPTAGVVNPARAGVRPAPSVR